MSNHTHSNNTHAPTLKRTQTHTHTHTEDTYNIVLIPLLIADKKIRVTIRGKNFQIFYMRLIKSVHETEMFLQFAHELMDVMNFGHVENCIFVKTNLAGHNIIPP